MEQGFNKKDSSLKVFKHPYEPFINYQTTRLIIGTTPPNRFTDPSLNNQILGDDVNFYYGSRDNNFWLIINEIFKVNMIAENSNEAIKQRKRFLENNKIGVLDIIKEFRRKNNDASDNNLEVLEYTNLFQILKDYPNINSIFFTGGKAESFTSRHLGMFRVFNTVIEKQPIKIKSFPIDGRLIKSYTLYSPSPRVTMVEDRRNQYKLLLNP